LCWNDVLEVPKRIHPGYKPEDETMYKEELHNEAKTTGENQVGDVLKCPSKVSLGSNGRSNQREHSERSDHNDPIDNLEKTSVNFLKDWQEMTCSFTSLFKHDARERDSKANGHDNHGSKVGVRLE
jgi:hypothetical protein